MPFGTPSEARKLLAALDPARDLAWMSDDAKLLYWRELTTDDHALGVYGSEIASAVRLTREARATRGGVHPCACAGGHDRRVDARA